MKKKVVETCEMCSAEIYNPVTIKVEGALLSVCHRCTSFGNVVKKPPTDEATVSQPKFHTTNRPQRTLSKRLSSKFSSKSDDGEKELVADYGHVIRKARMKKKLTQEQLSSKTGLSVPFIKSIEAGKMRPTDKAGKKIERELGIELFTNLETELEFSKKSESKGTTLGDIAVIKKYEYD